MPDILVIGSLNADLVVKSARFPQPGETISGEDLQIIPGGKGANQAVAAAKQGASVVMVGRVGNDSFAPFLVDNLKKNNIDTSHVLETDSATGTAIIVVDSSGQNSIVLSAGANGKVTPQDVDSAPDAKILLLQFEIPMETVLHAAKKYKSKNTTVILNPAPAKEISDELLSHVDILIPNESELSLLSKQQVTDVKSAESAAKELLKYGIQTSIVTLGKNGALIVTGNQVTQVKAYQVAVVDTTAAGDSFIGGFASKLLESANLLADLQEQALALQNAVQYANACGALATTKFGAQPSIPTKEEVEKFISNQT
ncbi:MAG: ribokinase [Anaerolineales bacterium]